MRGYPWLMVVGLFWAGPSWTGEEFCVAHGKMVRALAEARANGATEAALRAALLTPHTAEAVRILVDSNLRLVYASTDAPGVVAAKAEAACRTVTPRSRSRTIPGPALQ